MDLYRSPLTLWDPLPEPRDGKHVGETVYSVIVCDPEYLLTYLPRWDLSLDSTAWTMWQTFLEMPCGDLGNP